MFSPSPRSFIGQPKILLVTLKRGKPFKPFGSPAVIQIVGWHLPTGPKKNGLVQMMTFPFPHHYVDFFLVGPLNQPHLENMRTSNWIMKPHKSWVKHEKIFELPPPRKNFVVACVFEAGAMSVSRCVCVFFFKLTWLFWPTKNTTAACAFPRALRPPDVGLNGKRPRFTKEYHLNHLLQGLATCSTKQIYIWSNCNLDP